MHIKQYKVIQQIGKGAFSKVYLAQHSLTLKYVAIKLEKKGSTLPILEKESELYLELQNKKCKAIPKIKRFGEIPDYYYLIMDFLHETIFDIFKKTGSYSLLFTCQTAIQGIDIIQELHSHHVIHRDIKPGNFAFNDKKKLFIIDLGLSKYYFDEFTLLHIPYTEQNKLIGTMKYASINIHKGITYSRRDDLISFMYMIIELIKGHLPWSFCTCRDKRYTLSIMKALKQKCDMDKFCNDIPREFVEILDYCYKLDFEAPPNYDYIKQTFVTLLQNIGS